MKYKMRIPLLSPVEIFTHITPRAKLGLTVHWSNIFYFSQNRFTTSAQPVGSQS